MKGLQTYTFGLKYPSGIEEIDVQAVSLEAAVSQAHEIARRDYEPGWTELVQLPTGGSGGWITVQQL